jgi:large subunit ribosomal protein L13
MKTYSPSAKSITRKWILFDAKGKILGRLATEIAETLMGKNKPGFVRHLDIGDHVVVINAGSIIVTGHKLQQKLYHRHSGYPGGMKVRVLSNLLVQSPEKVIINAVAGMLPDNKLHDRMLKHLHVYAGPEHPYLAQFKSL